MIIIYGDANSSRQKKVVRISTSGNSELLGFLSRERNEEKNRRREIEKLGSESERKIQYFACKYSMRRYYSHLRVRRTTMPSSTPPPSFPKTQRQFTSFGIPFSLFNAACVCCAIAFDVDCLFSFCVQECCGIE